MKRTILLLALLVGGAFYLGWFTFSTSQNGTTEHVNIDIDTRKVKQDEAKAVQKLHQVEQQINQRNAQQIQADSGAASSTAAPAAAPTSTGPAQDEQAPPYQAPPTPPYTNPYRTAPAAAAPPARPAEVGARELDERFE